MLFVKVKKGMFYMLLIKESLIAINNIQILNNKFFKKYIKQENLLAN